MLPYFYKPTFKKCTTSVARSWCRNYDHEKIRSRIFSFPCLNEKKTNNNSSLS